MKSCKADANELNDNSLWRSSLRASPLTQVQVHCWYRIVDYSWRNQSIILASTFNNSTDRYSAWSALLSTSNTWHLNSNVQCSTWVYALVHVWLYGHIDVIVTPVDGYHLTACAYVLANWRAATVERSGPPWGRCSLCLLHSLELLKYSSESVSYYCLSYCRRYSLVVVRGHQCIDWRSTGKVLNIHTRWKVTHSALYLSAWVQELAA